MGVGDSPVLSQTWGAGDARYSALKAIVDALAKTSDKYISAALKLLMEDPKIKPLVGEGIMPYIYAAGLLSFSGREITDDSVSRLLKAIGVKPDRRCLDAIMESGVRSHLVYVYSFYFLLASNVDPNEERIMDIVSALGLKPDRERAREMREVCMLALNGQ